MNLPILRIIVTLIAVLFWNWTVHALLTPVGVIVSNQAAVASVNGGDAAYVASTAVQMSSGIGLLLGLTGTILIVFVLWGGILRRKVSA